MERGALKENETLRLEETQSSCLPESKALGLQGIMVHIPQTPTPDLPPDFQPYLSARPLASAEKRGRRISKSRSRFLPRFSRFSAELVFKKRSALMFLPRSNQNPGKQGFLRPLSRNRTSRRSSENPKILGHRRRCCRHGLCVV